VVIFGNGGNVGVCGSIVTVVEAFSVFTTAFRVVTVVVLRRITFTETLASSLFFSEEGKLERVVLLFLA
jgi:hypothetical protein